MGAHRSVGPGGPTVHVQAGREDLDPTTRERSPIVHEAGDSMPQFQTVAAMLRHWAAATPYAPMLTTDHVTLSWNEVYGRAKKVSRALAAEGVGPGDRVGFLDRNGSDYFEV